jgi:hypothetical protein
LSRAHPAFVSVPQFLPFRPVVLHPAIKYASVFLLSTVKFLGGPLAGISMGLHFWPTLGLTVAGMMTSVFIFSGVGRVWMQHRQKQRRLRREPIFSKKSRNIISRPFCSRPSAARSSPRCWACPGSAFCCICS